MDSLISGLYVVIYTVYGSLYHYIKYNEGYKPTHVSHFRAPPWGSSQVDNMNGLFQYGDIWLMNIRDLVGGWARPLWKMMDFVSWDYEIPNMNGKS
jgi:hypothetical protein